MIHAPATPDVKQDGTDHSFGDSRLDFRMPAILVPTFVLQDTPQCMFTGGLAGLPFSHDSTSPGFRTFGVVAIWTIITMKYLISS